MTDLIPINFLEKVYKGLAKELDRGAVQKYLLGLGGLGLLTEWLETEGYLKELQIENLEEYATLKMGKMWLKCLRREINVEDFIEVFTVWHGSIITPLTNIKSIDKFSLTVPLETTKEVEEK